ncbi:MAG TPA: YbaY family lipoprotein [Gammaproteobacteria bacterium]|nr:YbaY family lipoprotein [Gammaproteobacteria bacterium]
MSSRLASRLALAALATALCACGGQGGGAAPQGVLTGSVLYRERIALPPDARIEVRLEDVSRADAPADVLAEQTFTANGKQVPFPFELRYAPERIQANHRYSVRASIRGANGELMFASPSHHPVLERGAADQSITVLLQRVSATAQPGPAAPAAGGGAAETGGNAAGGAGGSLPSGTWRLVAIQRPGAVEEAVAGDARYTVAFADGRLTGLANCNRYTGGYEQPEPGKLKVLPMATTLMACPGTSIADEFLRAIGGATGYELRGERLAVTYGDGGTLTFARDEPTAAVATPPGSAVAALPAQAPEPTARAPVAQTFVYDCAGDLSFTVRTGPGEMALWAPKSLGGRYLVLSLARSASGARYTEGDTVFWSKGDVATIELGGQRYVDCKSNPSKAPWADAARRGAGFRALGNEPAWSLEIFADRLAVITELGARRTELRYAAPAAEGARTTYRASDGGHEAVAVVERRACADSMSGEAFDAAATVTFDGATLRGCGRYL